MKFRKTGVNWIKLIEVIVGDMEVVYFLVNIATDYGLQYRGLFPGRGQNCFCLHSVQTGPGSHPVSYPVAADLSSPSTAEIKNDMAIPPLPHTSSCQVLN
jgi:hypothetical protein